MLAVGGLLGTVWARFQPSDRNDLLWRKFVMDWPVYVIFLSFYFSMVGFLLSSVPGPFHSQLRVGVGWEEVEGLELGIDIISRQLSKLWWRANQSVLTSSLFSCSLSFHIPVFRFAIVKFVVKILILLNPSVSSDSSSLLSSPPPPPPPLLSSPHPTPFHT